MATMGLVPHFGPTGRPCPASSGVTPVHARGHAEMLSPSRDSVEAGNRGTREFHAQVLAVAWGTTPMGVCMQPGGSSPVLVVFVGQKPESSSDAGHRLSL